MALMTGILYALMAGAAFFVYLCWFRHVRDNVPGAGRRILYYFLVALTFVVLARATGVSVALGVLPMLVVMRFLPRRGLGAVLGWSLAFAAFSFAVGYVQARQMIIKDSHVTREYPSSDSAYSTAFNEYYTSKNIDPNLQFDTTQSIKIQDITLQIPVPMGTRMEYEQGKSDDSDKNFYVVIFKTDKTDKQILACLFQNLSVSSSEGIKKLLQRQKHYFTTNIKHNQNYKENLLKLFDSFESRTILEILTIEQYTQDSILAYSMLDLSGGDGSQFNAPTIGFIDGSIIIGGDTYLEFMGVSSSILGSDNKTLFTTWINKLLQINNTN